MAIYTIGVRTINTTTGQASFELRSGASRLRVREVGYFLATAVATTIGFGRPAAIGVTPTSPVTPTQNDPSDTASLSTTALAWATGPTIPAVYLRRVSLPAGAGAGVIWTFPDEIVVAASASLIIWNLSTTGTADIYVTFEE